MGFTKNIMLFYLEIKKLQLNNTLAFANIQIFKYIKIKDHFRFYCIINILKNIKAT